MELLTHYEGEVYYDSRTNRFVQIRQLHDDFYLCGGFSPYYSDARTTLTQQRLSHKYLQECQRVVAIDQCPQAYYNGIGWRTTTKDNTIYEV